ncbi:hypothetical protein DFS33DRAFT_656897 [Desarmillaria ectypa]|nr:hypothetical protein DFS33DRAFT_656897 [Desarmillaria ectypa]
MMSLLFFSALPLLYQIPKINRLRIDNYPTCLISSDAYVAGRRPRLTGYSSHPLGSVRTPKPVLCGHFFPIGHLAVPFPVHLASMKSLMRAHRMEHFMPCVVKCILKSNQHHFPRGFLFFPSSRRSSSSILLLFLIS